PHNLPINIKVANLPKPLAAPNMNLVTGLAPRARTFPRDCLDALTTPTPTDLLIRRLAPSLGLERLLFDAAFLPN
ncbi:MAG: hypothetical protein ACKOXE_04450, partial [Polynucleobacter victoriensis]